MTFRKFHSNRTNWVNIKLFYTSVTHWHSLDMSPT